MTTATKHEAHPAAELFPMMSAARLDELAESIRESGLRVPIILCDEKILDGRNRYLACERVGVTPRFTEFHGDDPFAYVWDLNGARRDLEAGQRAAIRLRLDLASAEWHEAKRLREQVANEARRKAAEERRGDDGRLRPKPVTKPKHPGGASDLSREKRQAPVPPPPAPPTPPATKPKPHAHDDLAKRANVSPATAARVQAVANKDPKLLSDVADGKIKLTEATRQLKKKEVAKTVGELPKAGPKRYRVIYADPPWKYGDERTGLASGYVPAANHYPTMSVSELSALDVKALAAPDCVLFCWATFPLLPDAMAVVRAWGFTYKTSFVWAKERANFGHYHDASAELLMVCTRGSATPDASKREKQVQVLKRTGRHSAKPEEFRALVDRLYTSGNRIELFRRGDAPEGWDVWGNEAKP